MLALRDREMSGSSGLGDARDKNSSNFKSIHLEVEVEVVDKRVGGSWKELRMFEAQDFSWNIPHKTKVRNISLYYETDGIITTIIYITYANALWCSLFWP